jgi:hypothetical protein
MTGWVGGDLRGGNMVGIPLPLVLRKVFISFGLGLDFCCKVFHLNGLLVSIYFYIVTGCRFSVAGSFQKIARFYFMGLAELDCHVEAVWFVFPGGFARLTRDCGNPVEAWARLASPAATFLRHAGTGFALHSGFDE